MSQQNSISKKYDPESSSFIFERIKETKTGISKVLVKNKESISQMVPLLKNFDFKPCYLAGEFEMYAEKIRNFKVRKDDVWVLSFPKTGNTLLSCIVSQLTQGFDFSDNVTDGRHKHSFDRLYHNLSGGGTSYSDKIEFLNGMESAPSQRIMKSHLPPNLLPVDLWTVQPKMIYITRNLKDTAISKYHMASNLLKDKCSFYSKEEYFEAILNGKSDFGPFDTHVQSFYQLCSLDNFLFVTYEELLADRFQGVKKISAFLECKYSDEELQKLVEYTSFNNMKQINDKIPKEQNFKAGFFRRGKVGNFVEEMTKKQIERFDKWTAENFHESGFRFAS